MNMFRHLMTLTAVSLDDPSLTGLLDELFQPEFGSHKCLMEVGGKQLAGEEVLEYWAENFRQNIPRTNHERLRYFSQSSISFWAVRQTGRVCQRYVWPKFFSLFPKGRIVLLELDPSWFDLVWREQFNWARDSHFSAPDSFFDVPQEMSGFQSDNFPSNCLLVAAYGIYPLLLFDFVEIMENVVFVYLPGEPMSYSQMRPRGVYQDILWHLCHAMDDQWTFDSSRGPKSQAQAREFSCEDTIAYIRWTAETIGKRMRDLLEIPTALSREQLAMTFSRAVCDCLLSTTSDLPYMSKTYFFACLDKLANVMRFIGRSSDDVVAWRLFFNEEFLRDELSEFLKEIPGSFGQFHIDTVEWVADHIRLEQLTPQLLRFYRNTHHGYNLHENQVEALYGHSGEINNDVTLLVTPLLMYVLGQKWTQR